MMVRPPLASGVVTDRLAVVVPAAVTVGLALPASFASTLPVAGLPPLALAGPPFSTATPLSASALAGV